MKIIAWLMREVGTIRRLVNRDIVFAILYAGLAGHALAIGIRYAVMFSASLGHGLTFDYSASMNLNFISAGVFAVVSLIYVARWARPQHDAREGVLS